MVDILVPNIVDTLVLWSVITMDIIENRYRMIIESERSGRTISDVCIAFGVSRQTWYKWKRRYNVYGLDGLKNQSKRPHNIENVKITKELEKIILELLADVVDEQCGAVVRGAGERDLELPRQEREFGMHCRPLANELGQAADRRLVGGHACERR